MFKTGATIFRFGVASRTFQHPAQERIVKRSHDELRNNWKLEKQHVPKNGRQRLKRRGLWIMVKLTTT